MCGGHPVAIKLYHVQISMFRWIFMFCINVMRIPLCCICFLYGNEDVNYCWFYYQTKFCCMMSKPRPHLKILRGRELFYYHFSLYCHVWFWYLLQLLIMIILNQIFILTKPVLVQYFIITNWNNLFIRLNICK